jgi:hypothetical protein
MLDFRSAGRRSLTYYHGLWGMGPVRRTISLICALALTAVSAYAFIYLIFYVAHYKFYMPAVAGVLTFV